MSLVPILVVFILGFGAPKQEPVKSSDQFTVYFFILEDCKITQAYIPEINDLHKTFSSSRIEFKAVFSNPSSVPDSVYAFLDKYPLALDIIFDEDQMIAHRFNIRIMPEVIVYHHNKKQVIYQGRIDNWFVSLGKRRAKPTQRDLRNCLAQIHKGLVPVSYKTDAIGCFLENQ